MALQHIGIIHKYTELLDRLIFDRAYGSLFFIMDSYWYIVLTTVVLCTH